MGNRIQDRQGWLDEDDKKHDPILSLRAGVEEMRKKALQHQYMYPNPGEQEAYNYSTGERGIAAGGSSTSATLSGAGLSTLYGLRILRSDLPNVHTETIEDISRLPFRSRIDLDGWDEELEGPEVIDESGRVVGRAGGWVDDMDGCGNTIDQWAQQNFEDSMFEGVTYSFVDNDPRSFESAADRKAQGGRPYVTTLHRQDVVRINWTMHAGRPRLLALAFYQDVHNQDLTDPNNWTDDAERAIKLVIAGNPDAAEGSEERRVRTQLWKKGEDAEYVLVSEGAIVPEGGEELLDIPLVPHYGKRVGPWRGVSPFTQTAWTQISVWNHNSELTNLARETSQIFVHETGADIYDTGQKNSEDGIRKDTATSRYVRSSAADAKLAIVESTGAPMAGIREFIEWKLNQIKEAHHQIRSKKPAVAVTASEITLSAVHADSALELWLIQHEHSWKKVLNLMALLGGHAKLGRVSIEHDFGLPNTGMERNMQLYVAGKQHPRNYYAEARRAGDIDETSFDVDLEVKSWEEARRMGDTEQF